jgi:hypothetical protein
MSEEKAWALRLHFWGMLLLGLLALLLLTVGLAGAQETKETKTKKPWTGKLKNGRVITKTDLDKILQAHALWVKTIGKKGQLANLSYADLSGADLSDADLSDADLSDADLSGAKLSGARLYKADLSGARLGEADLNRANLSYADLSRADLSGAILWGIRLNRADLTQANLRGAFFYRADLANVIFETKAGSVQDGSKFLSVKGLPSLKYRDSPHSLVDLREAFKKAGMREPERQVTYALNHNRRIKLWNKPGLLNKVESLFNLVCFEWPCQYGMNPGRPLKILGLGLFLFTPLYLLALRSRDRESGIWLVLSSDRILGRRSKDRPYKLTTNRVFRPLPRDSTRFGEKILRGWRLVRLAFYFSLVSAFNLGWRELNVGNWISRLQKNEYTFRATGWVRTVAGLQSLLSIYLLALWVLTYFGRPFD